MSRGAFQHLLFKRGYLLTSVDIRLSDNLCVQHVAGAWHKLSVGKLELHFDPELDFYEHTEGEVTVGLLGLAVDSFHDIPDEQEIVRRLAIAHRRSEEDLFEALDSVTGRHLLLLTSHSRTLVLQDALGARSVYYDTASPEAVVSSHASLIAELRGCAPSADVSGMMKTESWKRAPVSYLPGLSSRYSNVRILTPNTLLDTYTREVRRFFPRRRLESPCSYEEISAALRNESNMLAHKLPLAVSLTAGSDSRCTLSTLREVKDQIHCFTYVNERVLEAGNGCWDDLRVARRLCRRAGLRHVAYRVDRRSVGDDIGEFLEVWRKNTSGSRGDIQGFRAKVLYDNWPAGRVHLKSAASEVWKPFYRKHADAPPGTCAADLARLYRICPGSEFVLREFQDFMVTTQFDRLCGHDPLDMFYWEHRIGTWQVLQLLDFDVVHETILPFGARRLINMMLALPLEDRWPNVLMPRLIRMGWPELLDVPLNAHKFRAAQVKRLKAGVKRLLSILHLPVPRRG